MAQTVQLSVSGLYTAPSDYSGAPPGALSSAVNVESRHKNLLECRRGFDALASTDLGGGKYWVRLFNFPVDGDDCIIGLSSDGSLYYYDGTLHLIDGANSGFVPIDSMAKNRFVRGGQNMYLTDQSGVYSLSSGSGSKVIAAGVPRGLNLQAETNGDSSGFFTNNTTAIVTGNTTNASDTITNISDITDITVGQYISGTGIPDGTTISAISDAEAVGIISGTTTIASTTISFVGNPSAVAGQIVSGEGIQEGTRVVSQSGSGPYSVVVSLAPYRSGTTDITFSNPPEIQISNNATATGTSVSLTIYSGSQVAYRMLFGRVETDINGNTTTRYGAPSQMAVATNISGTSKNVTITGTIPKNSDDSLTFVQLYRSQQTEGSTIPPLDQMNLCYERPLVAGDFTARVITITDIAPDSFLGIPLYTGTDREGITKSNLPPPACWDMTVFRNIGLYANAVQPSTLNLTLDSVGSPSGLQVGDVITITAGATVRNYTAANTENAAAGEFKVYSAGTEAQDIADTANSIVRVINYDENLPVHAIYTSTETDLPGKFTLESDIPYGTFTATVDDHAEAFEPTLTDLESNINGFPNAVFYSKDGELESVPGLNYIFVGDSSSKILRILALRDYVIVLKTDGIYKIVGTTGASLTALSFDLTTKLIGPDTAVQLNSGVWMLSNQGIVSVDDAGVSAKSPPIDNQINELIGSVLDGINNVAFGVGYESDRKYILSVPLTNESEETSTQYVFNYVTNSWTNWDRKLHTAFIHGNEGKLYIGRADSDSRGISKERKSGTYVDYSDESIAVNILSVTSSTQVVLDSIDGVEVGDILYMSAGILSPILEVNTTTNEITLQYENAWVVGAATIINAISCRVGFKQVFGDNPAFCRQFSEGLALFKETKFNSATIQMLTDFSASLESVTLEGTLLTGWGLFPWGSGEWGGSGSKPTSIRFLVPANKQLGSYIEPTLLIKQAWSTWKFQGLSFLWSPVSPEVGR